MARSTISPADVIRYFMTHAEGGNLLDGKKIVATQADIAAGDREAVDSVIALMRKGDNDSGDSEKAVARHFLIADGVVVARSVSSNKAGDKRAAASALLFSAATDWPEAECKVASLVESSNGVSFWGVESAEDALSLFGVETPIGPEAE